MSPLISADWAIEVAYLMDTRYADCETIMLVNDNLNTHTKDAFYEAFPPDKAREYVRRRRLFESSSMAAG